MIKLLQKSLQIVTKYKTAFLFIFSIYAFLLVKKVELYFLSSTKGVPAGYVS